MCADYRIFFVCILQGIICYFCKEEMLKDIYIAQSFMRAVMRHLSLVESIYKGRMTND